MEYERYQNEYGIENVLCFWRSKIYFYYRVILPLLKVALLSAIFLIFFYRRLDWSFFVYILVAVLIIAIADLFSIEPVITRYIDYKMDFIIVTPASIMMYDQDNILGRKIHTITVQSIKAINIETDKYHKLLDNIFDIGSMIILTEGDSEKRGEIELRRIPDPEAMRSAVVKIVWIDEEHDPSH